MILNAVDIGNQLTAAIIHHEQLGNQWRAAEDIDEGKRNSLNPDKFGNTGNRQRDRQNGTKNDRNSQQLDGQEKSLPKPAIVFGQDVYQVFKH